MRQQKGTIQPIELLEPEIAGHTVSFHVSNTGEDRTIFSIKYDLDKERPTLVFADEITQQDIDGVVEGIIRTFDKEIQAMIKGGDHA